MQADTFLLQQEAAEMTHTIQSKVDPKTLSSAICSKYGLVYDIYRDFKTNLG